MFEYLARVSSEFYFSFILAVLLLTAGWWFGRKLKTVPRGVVFVILSLLALRLALFGNPFSWQVYIKLLTPDGVVGIVEDRQIAVMVYEKKKFLKKPEGIKYYSIGSSQTYALYTAYADRHDDFVMNSFPGILPFEYQLYRDYISSHNSEYVLLYLSEFDFARKPNLNAAKIAPRQGFYWLRLYPLLRTYYHWKDAGGVLAEMLAGEVFPEQKYSFIFQGLIDKLFGRNSAMERPPADSDLERNLKNLRSVLQEDAIDCNMALFEEFLRFCEAKKIKVAIVEGQYNPLAYTEKNLKLNGIVHKGLMELGLRYPNVIFVPRTTIFEFEVDQYRDGYHVKSEDGYNFTMRLVAWLEKQSM